MRRSVKIVFCGGVLCSLLRAAVLRGDAVFIQGLPRDGVVIQGVSDGKVTFTSSGGNQSSYELARVRRIHVDGETSLNTAEDAFAANRFADAVDDYQKAARSSTRIWVRAYAAGRLAEAAAKSNRFDAAVTAYIALVQANASAVRPELPAGSSSYIDIAIAQINDALVNGKLADPQKVLLLQFQIDLLNAKKDARGADQAAAQLDDLLAKDPSNPNAARAISRRKLQLAAAALAAKKYGDALATIQSGASAITDPSQQSDALFMIAQAREGLAEGGNDSNLWKDAALAYMRVVADFKDQPDHAHVTDSLLRTAAIEMKLNEMDAARSLYRQIGVEYPNTVAADTAKENLAKLPPTTAP